MHFPSSSDALIIVITFAIKTNKTDWISLLLKFWSFCHAVQSCTSLLAPPDSILFSANIFSGENNFPLSYAEKFSCLVSSTNSQLSSGPPSAEQRFGQSSKITVWQILKKLLYNMTPSTTPVLGKIRISFFHLYNSIIPERKNIEVPLVTGVVKRNSLP